ncbi:MAG: hypothetical protein ABI763_08850 [Bacteroidota bacterium]
MPFIRSGSVYQLVSFVPLFTPPEASFALLLGPFQSGLGCKAAFSLVTVKQPTTST